MTIPSPATTFSFVTCLMLVALLWRQEQRIHQLEELHRRVDRLEELQVLLFCTGGP